MAQFLKQLVILGVALPTSLLGYHLYAGAHGSEGEAISSNDGGFGQAVISRLSSKQGYSLKRLAIFEHDLWYVETRYVEPVVVKPDAMLQASLDAVERQFDEVLFQREPGGTRLNISVGRYSTVLALEPVTNVITLHEQLCRVAAVLDEHLSPEIARPDVEYALINGALSTLDPHTLLMPPEQADELGIDNDGEFGGLGITITVDDGYLTITEPLEGTPAQKADLQSGDRIVRIEDESTINMDLNDAVVRLRGPVGQPVTIQIMRKGFEAPRPFTIVRDVIRVNPVESELLPGGVAYLCIKSFNARVDADMGEHLARMRAKNGAEFKGLVLDLRGNPGGYLNQAVEAADRFLSNGVIVATVEGGNAGRRDERLASSADTEPDYPIVVLTNGSSASASEILAGALRNLDRAVIVGERTFGKGSVQHLYKNDDGSELKLTVAKYLTPGDQSIQSVGIPPDILLQPSVVRAAETKGDIPTISLYWRDWVSHESDLDHHLAQVSSLDNQPIYTVRYLRPKKDDVDPTAMMDDAEVRLARDIVLASQGSRRAEILARAQPVIETWQRQEAAKLGTAFNAVGLDWTARPNPADLKLEANLDLGADGVLKAGEQEEVLLRVTNKGSEPVYRISAVATSESAWMDHREFYFGRIDPGQTATARQRVSLPDGYGDELVPVKIALRDPDRTDLASSSQLVRAVGRLLPRLSYELVLHDGDSPASKGDSDGTPELGETVELLLTLTNEGEGPTRDAFARLKNKAGRDVDLVVGRASLGALRDADGEPCAEESEGCGHVLLPGESVSASLSLQLRNTPKDGTWALELNTGDNRAYDYAAVQRGGFYSFFQQTEKIALKPGVPLAAHKRTQPQVSVTRGPGLSGDASSVVISGKVTDPDGMRDVMIFQGDDKIFYEGGGTDTRSVPFTTEATLKPGSNLFVVLARDSEGMTSTSALTTWLDNGDVLDKASAYNTAEPPPTESVPASPTVP